MQAIAIHSVDDDWRSDIAYREFMIAGGDEEASEDENAKGRNNYKRHHSKHTHSGHDQRSGDENDADRDRASDRLEFERTDEGGVSMAAGADADGGAPTDETFEVPHEPLSTDADPNEEEKEASIRDNAEMSDEEPLLPDEISPSLLTSP